MKVDEVSDVIRQAGFILLKVTEHRRPACPPARRWSPDRNPLLQKLQPAMRIYLTKLREEAYIDIKQGYVDTGASPNQTKPIMTAATTEEEKKKKKKKLLIF
jgi:peptidyl-prolyl cis-trans isomerase SurA